MSAATSTRGPEMPPAFPLSAIVGQEALIEALLVNAVSPEIGGVLVRGDRGTAKTTAVRALASLLSPAPLVELPLGTTLDRLVGSIDLGRALSGEHAAESGLLARADGGILYVDEVNLLADHLVDALLDAAATGVVRVEREGISTVAPARFLLVGTMNPEEGELRPQLLDRFGLGIAIETPSDPSMRAEIVRRRVAFEADTAGFLERFAPEEAALRKRIESARQHVADVVLSDRELLRITAACARLGIDGVRGDLVTARAARALAALDGAGEVAEDHVRRAAELALAHRRRRDPLDGQVPDANDLEQALSDAPEPPFDDGPGGGDTPGGGSPAPENGGRPPTTAPSTVPERATGSGASGQAAAAAPERVAAPVPARLPDATVRLPGRGRGPLGRRALSAGRQTGAIDARRASPDAEDLAVVASLRSVLRGEDALYEHIRAGRESAFICLVIDASGSMGARRRAAKVKGALLEFLRDAYARRDRVAVIAFRDHAATVVVQPGAPLELAAAALRALPTGGRTPLAEGLGTAATVIRREQIRGHDRRSVAIVLTDGRAADPDGRIVAAAAALGATADAVSVVDIEDGPVRLGLATRIAVAAGGEVYRLTSDFTSMERAA